MYGKNVLSLRDIHECGSHDPDYESYIKRHCKQFLSLIRSGVPTVAVNNIDIDVLDAAFEARSKYRYRVVIVQGEDPIEASSHWRVSSVGQTRNLFSTSEAAANQKKLDHERKVGEIYGFRSQLPLQTLREIATEVERKVEAKKAP